MERGEKGRRKRGWAGWKASKKFEGKLGTRQLCKMYRRKGKERRRNYMKANRSKEIRI